jgi:hypothetical protein
MTVYEIHVKEHLDSCWSDWFAGLTVTNEANGQTVLTGEVIDLAALHGLLSKVHGLQLTLLSLRAVETKAPAQRGREEQTEGGPAIPIRR